MSMRSRLREGDSIVRRVGLAWAVCLMTMGVATRVAQAQGHDCGEVLRRASSSRDSTSAHASPRYYDVLSTVRTLTLDIARARLEGDSGRRSDRLPSIHVVLPSGNSPSETMLLAEVLAEVMESESAGFSSAQAAVASDLYRVWSLPPRPAFSLAEDPQQGMFSRSLAIRAAQPSWQEPAFHSVALSVVCSLAARAEGVQSALGVSAVVRPEVVLNDDELTLLSWIANALSATEAKQRGLWGAYLRSMPRGNAVVADLERAIAEP